MPQVLAIALPEAPPRTVQQVLAGPAAPYSPERPEPTPTPTTRESGTSDFVRTGQAGELWPVTLEVAKDLAELAPELASSAIRSSAALPAKVANRAAGSAKSIGNAAVDSAVDSAKRVARVAGFGARILSKVPQAVEETARTAVTSQLDPLALDVFFHLTLVRV